MDMLDPLNATKIINLDNRVLKDVYGGASISGTLINAINSALKTILDLGRSLGTSIKRIKTKSLCKAA